MTITDRFVGVVVAIRQAATRLTGRVTRTSAPGAGEEGETDDPVLAFLAQAPVDDEPVTAADERAIAAGWDAYQRGESTPAIDAKRQTLGAGGPERAAPV